MQTPVSPTTVTFSALSGAPSDLVTSPMTLSGLSPKQGAQATGLSDAPASALRLGEQDITDGKIEAGVAQATQGHGIQAVQASSKVFDGPEAAVLAQNTTQPSSQPTSSAISALEKAAVQAPVVPTVEAPSPPVQATAPVAAKVVQPAPTVVTEAAPPPVKILVPPKPDAETTTDASSEAGAGIWGVNLLGLAFTGASLVGAGFLFDRDTDTDEETPPVVVDPGPPAPPPVSPPPPPVAPPPAAPEVTLFDPTEAIVEGFELDGPLVGVAETLQSVTESALSPLVGESFQPDEPGVLDGTDGVLSQVVSVLPEDLLATVGEVIDRPVPMDFNGLLLDQLDVVTDAATVLVLDNPVSGVLGGVTGDNSSSSPTGVLNFVDNLVSGEQLGTSVPPITSAVANLPGSLAGALTGLSGT